MLAESHPLIRRCLRFLALPLCFIRALRAAESAVSPLRIAADLLYIFFTLKCYPDNYGPCRLWEQDRRNWALYYGSTYNPYPRRSLRRRVQMYDRQSPIHDKHVAWRLMAGYDVRLPVTYGVVSPEEDYRTRITGWLDASGQDALIIKPVLGHAGLGICIAQRREGDVLIRAARREIPIEAFSLTEEAIVQNVVTQDSRVAAFAAGSLNTIRVVTLLTGNNEVMVVNSTMRFGTGTSFVDNWSAGGVAVGVDHEQGRLLSTAYDKIGRRYSQHPDSGLAFADFEIPCWDEIIAMATRVQEICSFYRLMGVDIALSPEGPVLIEINANPDIVFQEQTSGPLFANERVLKEFETYGLLYNAQQIQLARRLREGSD